MDPAERAVFERALGPQRRLDGSLASLWAVEDVLYTVQRAPTLEKHVSWLGDYLATLVERCFREMGADTDRVGRVVRSRGPIRYEVDLDEVVEGLVRPPALFPTFYGQHLRGLPVLGRATAPMWGVATAFMNHTWAKTEHALIGTQRDRMDQAYPWVVAEHAAQVDGPEDEVKELLRSMIWAPLGYPQNTRGEHNRQRLGKTLGYLDREAAPDAVAALLHHPDDAIALLAGWCAMALDRHPTDASEAHWMRCAVAFFRIAPRAPIAKAIRALDPRQGDDAGGGDPETIGYLRELSREPPEEVLPLVDDLVRQHDAAAYWTARGFEKQRLRDWDGALADHSAAIARDPDFFLARTNRGVLRSQLGDHQGADEDLAHALALDPFSRDARNNLLLNTLFARG